MQNIHYKIKNKVDINIINRYHEVFLEADKVYPQVDNMETAILNVITWTNFFFIANDNIYKT